jgi:hypothetical protein
MHVLASGFVELGLELVRGLERRDLFVAAAAVNDVHHVGRQLRRACIDSHAVYFQLLGCARRLCRLGVAARHLRPAHAACS